MIDETIRTGHDRGPFSRRYPMPETSFFDINQGDGFMRLLNLLHPMKMTISLEYVSY